ncbi:hypothetical protein [Rhizobium esperanzae]|uniref:Uncharacterized protein n=1 Tax=Rhizobium esperanzae TaxID=1967781 RepID=A0A7W6W643_9HYPH|nr:hypothetical protein [Rhizobium esperanzae]MBB4237314.1 hypothetical protein [Rhizobium esperanzae]
MNTEMQASFRNLKFQQFQSKRGSFAERRQWQDRRSSAFVADAGRDDFTLKPPRPDIANSGEEADLFV